MQDVWEQTWGQLWGLCLLVWLAGCTTQQHTAQMAVFGTVVANDSNQVMAGVRVLGAGKSGIWSSTVTDAHGAFTLDIAAMPTEYVVVKLEAPGYSAYSRRLQVFQRPSFLPARLAPVDVSTTFQTPDTGQTVALHLGHDGAAATLTVPANSLMRPDGSVVSGSVSGDLTFFSPAKSLEASPGILRYAERDGTFNDALPRYLLSYGMIDIELSQNGERLQVVPGQTLALDMNTTETLRAGYLRKPATTTGPTLWTLNPNTGLWVEDVGDGSYDPNTGIMHAVLRHLSSKNMDEPLPPGEDPLGCVRGHVVGTCGNPIAGASVTITFNSNDYFEGRNYTYTATTDANGEYAIDQIWPSHVVYYATAQFGGDTTDSGSSPVPAGMTIGPSDFYNAANPIPGPLVPAAVIGCSTSTGICADAACSCYNDVTDNTCLQNYGNDQRNSCWIDPLGNWPAGTANAGLPCYNDFIGATICNMAYVWKTQTVGTLCQNCWPMLDLVLPIAGDASPTCTTNCCAGTTIAAICANASSPLYRAEGQPCNPAGPEVCCPSASLVCSDNLCVPATDP